MPKPTGWILAAVFACAAAGCGQRKATAVDCQLIVDRLVEVELRAKNVTDPVAVAKKQEDIRATVKDELKDCVGRTVSSRMMDCVGKADTTDKVMACIR